LAARGKASMAGEVAVEKARGGGNAHAGGDGRGIGG
jgi:hypothetical protein